jgi:hypothetical protein
MVGFNETAADAQFVDVDRRVQHSETKSLEGAGDSKVLATGRGIRFQSQNRSSLTDATRYAHDLTTAF